MTTFWPNPRGLARRLRQNLLLRIFSFAFAVGLWAFVNLGERDAEKTMQVPVVFRGLPEHLAVTSPVVEGVDVRVRGPRTLLGTLEERRGQVITVDLSNVRAGRTTFRVDGEMLSLPRGVRVVRVSPSQLQFDVDRMSERSVPLVADLEATPPGFRVVDVEVTPRRVTLSGPASAIDAIREVRTERVPLGTQPGVVERSAAVRRDDPGLRVSPSRVDVHFRLEEVFMTREFKNVEVGVRGADAEAVKLKTRWVNVSVRGPERLLRTLEFDPASVRVDANRLAPGSHRLKVQVELPEGLELGTVRPDAVDVQVGGGKKPSR
jgi:YbbR domain-containing protein